ncbi:hypothetical protein [Streptomyces nitrosporeus]|uniref:hypothetical protein n=1 Tax=Streptomyces nitrosporeus TaxID=28894 RepID=UPI0039A1D2EF
MSLPALPGVSLPDPLTLSDAQQRGTHCVWCTAPLAADAARDLGPRLLTAHGTRVTWFPRACPTCYRDRT